MSTTTPTTQENTTPTTETNKKRDREVAEVNTVQETSSKRIRKIPQHLEDFDMSSSVKSKSNTPSTTTATATASASSTASNGQPIQKTKKVSKKELLDKLKQQATKLNSLLVDTNGAQVPDTQTAETVKSPVEEKPKKGKRQTKTNGNKGRKKKQTSVSNDEYTPQQHIGTRARTKKGEEKRPKRQRKPPQRDYDEDRSLPEPMRQCQKILTQLKQHRWAWPFLQPVDPVELNIPDYYDIIKRPMDLGTVQSKLKGRQYQDVFQFAEDVRLIWKNCFTYNPPGTDIVKMAETLSNLFEEKFKKLAAQYSEGSLQAKVEELEQNLSDLQKQLGEKVKAVKAEPLPIVQPPQPAQTVAQPVKKPKQNNQKKKKPPSHVIDSRYMTFDEKKRLSANIGRLSSDKLARVVEIIQSRAPKASSQANESEIEIDLDKLDAVTLRQLEKYVKSALSVAKRKRSKPKTKKEGELQQTTDTTGVPTTQQGTTEAPKPEGTERKDEETESSSSGYDSDSGSSGSDSSETETSSDSESDSEKKPVDPSAPKPLSESLVSVSEFSNILKIKIPKGSKLEKKIKALEPKNIKEHKEVKPTTQSKIKPITKPIISPKGQPSKEETVEKKLKTKKEKKQPCITFTLGPLPVSRAEDEKVEMTILPVHAPKTPITFTNEEEWVEQFISDSEMDVDSDDKSETTVLWLEFKSLFEMYQQNAKLREENLKKAMEERERELRMQMKEQEERLQREKQEEIERQQTESQQEETESMEHTDIGDEFSYDAFSGSSSDFDALKAFKEHLGHEIDNELKQESELEDGENQQE